MWTSSATKLPAPGNVPPVQGYDHQHYGSSIPLTLQGSFPDPLRLQPYPIYIPPPALPPQSVPALPPTVSMPSPPGSTLQSAPAEVPPYMVNQLHEESRASITVQITEPAQHSLQEIFPKHPPPSLAPVPPFQATSTSPTTEAAPLLRDDVTPPTPTPPAPHPDPPPVAKVSHANPSAPA